MKYLWAIFLISFSLSAQSNQKSSATVADEFDHQTWDLLLDKHVSDLGQVDYQGFLKDMEALEGYIESLSRATESINELPKTEQLAFWINAYNACTVKLICDHLPLTSIKDISRPWKQTVMKNNNHSWTLNDIEHDILRKLGEPRIHFAINCASKSCPVLSNEAYRAKDLEEQLRRSTSVFLMDQSKNRYTSKRLYLSRIFLWFKRDFGNTQDLFKFIMANTDMSIDEDPSISFLPYDWSLNN